MVKFFYLDTAKEKIYYLNTTKIYMYKQMFIRILKLYHKQL